VRLAAISRQWEKYLHDDEKSIRMLGGSSQIPTEFEGCVTSKVSVKKQHSMLQLNLKLAVVARMSSLESKFALLNIQPCEVQIFKL
jgi:hypothetical protein